VSTPELAVDAGAAPRPGRPGRPGRRAGRRKTAVLDAACRVIAVRGAEATRFADVAEASGVPVSTLQYYFGSREDLLVAAFRHASATELAALSADLADTRSPWRRIEHIVSRALSGYEPASPEAGLLWIESWHFAIRDPEMRIDALRDYEGWRGLVADAVRMGTAAGAFRRDADAAQIGVLAIALVDGAGIPLALGDPSLSVASATASVLATLASVLGVS
jgi:AcrR family transcriptional regulator